MTEIHGFKLVQERHIPEINTQARLYEHLRTGAQVLSLENDDENKSFCVGFQTPPADDTGLPHILEHSVLCGSRKYPVKDPFVQLLKTSVKTFLNAMTFDDMTIYPVASTNLKDFYNLVDVYMDAVFYPLIPEEVLMQEGWHYEAQDKDDQGLIYKGVVFNEMKAAFSMPERVLGYTAQRELMPDTPYAYESGGIPAAIPDLTYEQFKSFHETYYHPSNARIIFYGDDDPETRLKLVDDFITDFDRLDVDSELALQPPFDAPRKLTAGYDAGDSTADENKTMMMMSWLLPEITDRQTITELSILSYALVSSSASPLRKVLLDSGLGEDLTGGGLDTFKRQATFNVGMKGINADDAEKVEALILETLSQLAEEGIDQATVEAALNTIEFSMRERNTGRFPRGLMTAIYALPAWMHGGDPIDSIAFEERLNIVKQRLAEQDDYFERMIGDYFLDNSHRSTVILTPDPQAGKERDEAERQRLANVHKEMNDDDIQAVINTQERLRVLQETPDTAEDLAKIPSLTLDDIDREIKTTSQDVHAQDGLTRYFHEQPTAGVVYLDLALDLRQLSSDYLPYLELFSDALTRMGTQDETYVQFTQRIGSKTGGIRVNNMTNMNRAGDDYVAYMFIRSKAMTEKIDDLLAILKDMLLTVNLDDKERFRQLLLARKARTEQYLAMVGHQIAASRVKAHFNVADWVSEQLQGANALFFMRDLVDRLDDDWDAISAALHHIRETLVNRQALVVNVTAERDVWQGFEAQLDQFLSDLPAQDASRQAWTITELPQNEAFTMPLQVNFNAKATNLYDLGYTLNGSNAVIRKLLNSEYIWQKIRVQGGAYGGRLMFDTYSGIAAFLSWRDPNIVGTLQNFDQSGAYLRALDLREDDLEKAIIGAVGDLDSHSLPDAKGFQAMLRHQLGYTDEMRQQYRDEVLGTTLADFRAFGDYLDQLAQVGHAAVVGSPQAIASANDELDSLYTVTKLL